MAKNQLPAGIGVYQRGRTDRNRVLVQRAIDEILAAGDRVSFRNVADRTGICRSTLYRNGVFRSMVDAARSDKAPEQSIAQLGDSLAVLQREVEGLRGGSCRCMCVEYALVHLSRPFREMTHTRQ